MFIAFNLIVINRSNSVKVKVLMFNIFTTSTKNQSLNCMDCELIRLYPVLPLINIFITPTYLIKNTMFATFLFTLIKENYAKEENLIYTR